MRDKVSFTVRGGTGGDGSVSFRREKYVAHGGPDGGDGGDGGDVIVVATESVQDLMLIEQKRVFMAESGDRGSKWRGHGRRGENLGILVPVGTVVSSKVSAGEKELLSDLTMPGQKVLVARGGKGGLGNTHFATAVNQTPEIAGEGRPGEESQITLELKSITDMCIIGCPNSGKSALLSAVSGAKPKVADYPFTTRQPVFGVIRGSRRDFVVAEIPGLIVGAHNGKGLGYDFLRHVERTKLLIYLLDGISSGIGDDLIGLVEELSLYKADLRLKQKVVVVNKVDVPQVRSRFIDIKQELNLFGAPVFFISAVTMEGVLEFTSRAIELVERVNQEKEITLHPEVVVFRPEPRRQKR